MNYLVTGAAGQLGQDLAALLPRGETLLTDRTAHPELGIVALDITDEAAVNTTIASAQPGAIFHCAAYTNVEGAEDDPAGAEAVNVTGTRSIAQVATATGAKLVAISTDYVFDGTKADPYVETDPTQPLSIYGRTKRDGEQVALELCPTTFLVRSAWLYGPKQERIPVKNFPKTMRRLASTRPEIGVVADQVGSPTFTHDLAEALVKVAATDDYGIWHIANSGFASWYEFARAILRDKIAEGLIVKPITTADYPTKAARPANSRLDTTKFSKRFGALRSWQDALAEYLKGNHSEA